MSDNEAVDVNFVYFPECGGVYEESDRVIGKEKFNETLAGIALEAFLIPQLSKEGLAFYLDSERRVNICVLDDCRIDSSSSRRILTFWGSREDVEKAVEFYKLDSR